MTCLRPFMMYNLSSPSWWNFDASTSCRFSSFLVQNPGMAPTRSLELVKQAQRQRHIWFMMISKRFQHLWCDFSFFLQPFWISSEVQFLQSTLESQSLFLEFLLGKFHGFQTDLFLDVYWGGWTDRRPQISTRIDLCSVFGSVFVQSATPESNGVGCLQDWCIPGHRMDDTEMLEKLWRLAWKDVCDHCTKTSKNHEKRCEKFNILWYRYNNHVAITRRSCEFLHNFSSLELEADPPCPHELGSRWISWCCCMGVGVSRYSAPLGVTFNCLCANSSCQTFGMPSGAWFAPGREMGMWKNFHNASPRGMIVASKQ